MHSLLSYGGDEDVGAEVSATAISEPAPAPVQALPAQDVCRGVAANTRARAAADGFDAATQDRMTQQSLTQCAAMGPG